MRFMYSLLTLLVVLALSGIAGAKQITKDDLKDEKLKAHVGKVENLVKKLGMDEKREHLVYTRIKTSQKELEELAEAVETLALRKGDPKAAKERQLKESQLRIMRNKVYLGLWSDIGEKAAKVIGTLALDIQLDGKQEKDASLKELLKDASALAEDPLTRTHGALAIFLFTLTEQMESVPDMKH